VRGAYGTAVLVFSLLFVALGIALIVRTVQAGGGVGYLIGALFIGLGVGRFVLQKRR
jgi:hypothetical protein